MWQKIVNWLKAPFTQPLDATHLFLVVGLILVMVGIWYRILYYIREGATEVIE